MALNEEEVWVIVEPNPVKQVSFPQAFSEPVIRKCL